VALKSKKERLSNTIRMVKQNLLALVPTVMGL
jgi:hypothetical protein